jgi:hypothetical protein
VRTTNSHDENGLDEADQIALVSDMFGMVWDDGTAKEGDWPMALV